MKFELGKGLKENFNITLNLILRSMLHLITNKAIEGKFQAEFIQGLTFKAPINNGEWSLLVELLRILVNGMPIAKF